ncbi:MAG: choice-of-anchor A family protein [Lachnospiraceae bacterium]|nr:choice-of-anchor A family protein [Lachnospiraceae bacterium]
MKRKIPTKVKRILAIITALLLIIALNMGSAKAGAGNYLAYNLIDKSKSLNTAYTLQNHFGGTAYSSPAFDFHIFAEEVTLGGHTNGNIAANQLYANTHTFGAKQNNHLGKREDNYIGQYAEALSNINSNGNIVLGKTITTNISKQEGRISIGRNSNFFDQQTSAKIYQETNSSTPYLNIAAELSNLRNISSNLSKLKTSEDVTLSKVSGEHQSITVSGSGKNHYLNVTASEISTGNQKRILNISMPASTTLIINVDMKDASIHSLANLVTCLNGYSNGEQVISDACGLMWNLYDSGNANRQFVTNDYACVGCSDYFFGTILAPSAQIRYGAVNGSIIAKKTYQDGKESHRFDFTGYTDPEPPTEEPTSEKPTTEQPTSEKQTTEQPTSEKPTTEQPTSEKPTTEQPTSEKPTTEQPTSEKPTTEQPTSEKPTTEQPTSEKPTTEQPTSEKPTTEQPTSEKPTTEQPTSEKPTTEQPTTEQPIVSTAIVPNKPVSISISAQKILKDHTLSDKQFTFRIVDANNATIATAQNDASGRVAFDPITFQTAGFYTYYIVEVNDEQKNIHYDDSSYPVTIQVTHFGNGTMTVHAEYEENPIFTNLYVKQKAVTTTQQATTTATQQIATSAKTGDETNPTIYLIVFITSMGLLTTLYIYVITSKKKSDK